MDANVPKIRPRDEELARIQDNLANTLQGVLDDQSANQGKPLVLAPTMAQPRGAGTASVVKIPALQIKGRPDGAFQVNEPTITFGSPRTLSAPGVSTPQQDAQLFSWGQIVLFGSSVQQDGVVIIPQVAGPAFRIAPDNRYTSFQINYDGSANCTGPFSAASVRSDAGFKCSIAMGTFTTSQANGADQSVLTYTYDIKTGQVSPVRRQWAASRAGSVTALSVNFLQAVNTTGLVTVYKNDSFFISFAIPANVTAYSVTYAKGSNPFVANDKIRMIANYSGNVNVYGTVDMEVELGA